MDGWQELEVDGAMVQQPKPLQGGSEVVSGVVHDVSGVAHDVKEHVEQVEHQHEKMKFV